MLACLPDFLFCTVLRLPVYLISSFELISQGYPGAPGRPGIDGPKGQAVSSFLFIDTLEIVNNCVIVRRFVTQSVSSVIDVIYLDYT